MLLDYKRSLRADAARARVLARARACSLALARSLGRGGEGVDDSPGLRLSRCSLSYAVIWDTVVKTSAQ